MADLKKMINDRKINIKNPETRMKIDLTFGVNMDFLTLNSMENCSFLPPAPSGY